MTVATLREILDVARAGSFGVAGLVVLGWEDARAFAEAADETGLPIVLQAGPGARRHTPVAVLGAMFRHVAENARVPVACHIDHATTLDECLRGIEAGFTSVMIDGSSLPLAENIALTRRVVEAARASGVSVEGEVGYVGYAGGPASAFTAPDDAVRFAAETEVDALAVSVGNVHLQTEKTRGIDMAALGAIAAVTQVPLVLHGGSGIDPVTRRLLARQYRVAKFNIGTELRQAFGGALRQVLAEHPERFDRNEILSATIPGLRAAARDVITNLGPD
ncbi:class II fructose-bisphosphate aldolase [Aestuariivirga litoralis]|uniref:Class II fructose-bisphosphate aldolase n=1 Tax=Aestuariivirga litoralis TaxID=2650924 RepID=A0A2W2BB89_9HYPH|nr:class II fructose-bisphosphate aldolase [Aestuariivirga litoralis]PZF77534.1 class II fructose-bisphosphate aldolase [Aestuariivirga litoralis]